MDFINRREGGMFSVRFSSFLLSSVQVTLRKNCVSFEEISKKFEEIEISMQSCRGDCE